LNTGLEAAQPAGRSRIVGGAGCGETLFSSVDELREGGPDRCPQPAPTPRLSVERQHITVLGARVVDVRELGDEQGEVHGDSFNKDVKLENVAPEWTSSVSARARRVDGSTWEGTHQALQSGEVNGARRADTSSRRSTRVWVGHGKLPGDVWPVRGTDVFNHTPTHARLRRCVINGVNE
jgi:hypothetical protein